MYRFVFVIAEKILLKKHLRSKRNRNNIYEVKMTGNNIYEVKITSNIIYEVK